MSGRRQDRGPDIGAIRDRIDIAAVVGRVVKLGKGARPRGTCPFHGSKSDSFALDPDRGRARCWGCGWAGDAIDFVRDYYGLGFADALVRLADDHGLDGVAADPVRRAKAPVRTRGGGRETVDSATFGRLLWQRGRCEHDAARVYYGGRGIGAAVLHDDRLRDIRFCALAPIVAWAVGAAPESVPQAPAIVALVRRPGTWAPIGVHATFLTPDLTGKMDRRRGDGSAYPARKMLGGSAGGCVMLGRPVDEVRLYDGEGLETVLAGMEMSAAPPADCGMAALSLDNLQGRPLLVRGALPLFDPRVDPAAPGLAFRRSGPVTALIDADMKPLRGPVDRVTGAARGVPVIEKRHGPVVRRTVTTAERAALCGALVAQSWRAAGCRATVMRPPMGQDFNDALRERS